MLSSAGPSGPMIVRAEEQAMSRHPLAFIAPLCAALCPYRKRDGSIGEYEYKTGEAIIFGDHSCTRQSRGSRRARSCSVVHVRHRQARAWEKIARTAGQQGNLMRLPDGKFLVRDIGAD